MDIMSNKYSISSEDLRKIVREEYLKTLIKEEREGSSFSMVDVRNDLQNLIEDKFKEYEDDMKRYIAYSKEYDQLHQYYENSQVEDWQFEEKEEQLKSKYGLDYFYDKYGDYEPYFGEDYIERIFEEENFIENIKNSFYKLDPKSKLRLVSQLSPEALAEYLEHINDIGGEALESDIYLLRNKFAQKFEKEALKKYKDVYENSDYYRDNEE